MSTTCLIEKKNLSISRCNNLPGLISGMITTPSDFELDPEDFATITAMQNAIIAAKGSRVYLWPSFKGFENVSEEAVYEETPLADLAVRDGKYRFRFHIVESLCLHKAMFTHRATSGRAFMFDLKGQIIGTEKANGKIAGVSLNLLNTEKLLLSDGSISTKTPVYVVLKDNLDIDERGVTIKSNWLNDLVPLSDVTLTVESASSTEVVVSVKTSCDGIPVNGLVDADFVLLDGSGAAQSIDSLTEDDGVYTLVGTGLVTGTVNLVSAANLSLTGFESTGAKAVTI
jgi:hypothetical protein